MGGREPSGSPQTRGAARTTADRDEGMTGLASAIAVSGLLMTATIAAAQDASGYPDMRGQWNGTSDSVVLGSGMYHREGGAPGEPLSLLGPSVTLSTWLRRPGTRAPRPHAVQEACIGFGLGELGRREAIEPRPGGSDLVKCGLRDQAFPRLSGAPFRRGFSSSPVMACCTGAIAVNDLLRTRSSRVPDGSSERRSA